MSFVCMYGQVSKDIDSVQIKAAMLLESIEAKYQRVNGLIDKASGLPMQKLDAAQAKLQKFLSKHDKNLASDLSGQFKKYNELVETFKKKETVIRGITRNYFGRMDSLATGLQFLTGLPSSEMKERLQGSMDQLTELKAKYENLFRFEEQLKKHQAIITEKIGRWASAKEFKKYQQRIYAVRSEVNVIKEELAYPDKLATRALGYLGKIPAFDAFYRKHSQYAALFNIPGGSDGGNDLALQGLQTRTMVEKMLQDKQLSTGEAGAGGGLQQQLSQATQQLDQLKLKGLNLQKGDLPDIDARKYQPIQGKRKTILDHFELGLNVQTVRGRYMLPVTSDLGFSLGYKIRKWGIAGLGVSYKMGWGSGFNDIKITHQGAGLRSFGEVKLKGQLYAVAGYEMNYLTAFDKLDQLRDFDAWQKSGLAGISKKFSVGKKVKGSVQLLWDFLSYDQIPRAQPFLFRVGYMLK